jgi:hypothetical protein
MDSFDPPKDHVYLFPKTRYYQEYEANMKEELEKKTKDNEKVTKPIQNAILIETRRRKKNS